MDIRDYLKGLQDEGLMWASFIWEEGGQVITLTYDYTTEEFTEEWCPKEEG